MRLSKYPIKTLKYSKEKTKSFDLFLRAGYIFPISSGIFIYQNPMLKVIRNVIEIVREEMDKKGAIEISMPVLQPKTLWESSGRWENYIKSKTLFYLKDRKGQVLALGPTHEEVITYLVSKYLKSYKDLPFNFYQIGLKFRDELRPKAGLLRTREFIMKDAYSFDKDEQGLEIAYQKMKSAYIRIFERLNLEFVIIEADPGQIGGSVSNEFMVLSNIGEDTIVLCNCGYKANIEKAESKIKEYPQDKIQKPIKKILTKGIKKISALEKFTGINSDKILKTIIYQVDYPKSKTEIICCIIRGDYEINETKLARVISKYTKNTVLEVKPADEDVVKQITGASIGFSGPINLKKRVKLIADKSVVNLKNFLCGANIDNYHFINVNWKRDLNLPKIIEDIRKVKADDMCINCGKKLKFKKGIEIGHLFKLGVKYSEAMECLFEDKDGRKKPAFMGCYGIGITRVIMAICETLADDKGIVWPENIAPFKVCIVIADIRQKIQKKIGEEIYIELKNKGINVVLDDRDERIGYKLTDAELVGYPYIILIGNKVKKGILEIRKRDTLQIKEVEIEKISEYFK